MTRKESNQTKYFEIMKGKQFNYHQIILYLLDAEHALNFCFYSVMIWKKKNDTRISETFMGPVYYLYNGNTQTLLLFH